MRQFRIDRGGTVTGIVVSRRWQGYRPRWRRQRLAHALNPAELRTDLEHVDYDAQAKRFIVPG